MWYMRMMDTRMPAGVIVLAIERALAGIALGWLAYGDWQFTQGTLGWWLAVMGALYAATAIGLIRRKWWGWLLAVIETVAGIAGGVVGVTWAALSFPSGWGRGWLAGFIGITVVAFAALVALLVALAQAQSFFKGSEQQWRAEKWNRVLITIALVLFAMDAMAIGFAVRQAGLPQSAEMNGETGLAQAMAYCDGLAAGSLKDSCAVQVALAASERGDMLPADFCARVSSGQPQLKFLCIAYARQIESCDAFGVPRERALCRALVGNNVEECASLADDEQEVCARTVTGYTQYLFSDN